MHISPFDREVNPSQLPLDKLAANSSISEEKKMGELCRQFEAVLLRQILNEAQKTVIKSSFSEETLANDIYHDLTVNQLAESISRSGSFGLARTLETQLTQQLREKRKTPEDASLED